MTSLLPWEAGPAAPTVSPAERAGGPPGYPHFLEGKEERTDIHVYKKGRVQDLELDTS